MNQPLNHDRRKRPAEISTLLPADVRDALVKASKIASPTMRAIKIDAIYTEARFKYPTCFKAE